MVVVGFTRVRPRVWVHPVSLGSLRLDVVELGWVHSGFSLGVVVFIRGRWVYSGSPWGSLGSSGVTGFNQVRHRVVEFTRVRPAGRTVHAGSLGSLGIDLGVVRFIHGHCVQSYSP